MPERTLVAIHDPHRRLAAGEAQRRLEAALVGAPQPAVRGAGALAVGCTPAGADGAGAPAVGCTPAGADGASPPLIVVDGDASAQRTPLTSSSSALAGLRELRGAFALVIWDEDAQRGLIARDHLGARPLFYATSGSALYVASEIAPLLAALPRRPAPDRDELTRRLAGKRGEGGATLYAAVRELPAAHALLLDQRGWRLERYWRPRARPGLEDVDPETAAAALRAGVQAAVGRHAAAHGPIGVLVSGGLDSSTVLACAIGDARASGTRPPSAFSGIFPDHPHLDEGRFVAELVAHCDAELVRVPVRAGPIGPFALAHLERWAVPLEHPGGAFFVPVQEAAAARGIRVLLDGEGGDELFGCEPFLIADRLLAGDVRGALRLTRALPGLQRLDARSLRVVLRRWILPALLPAAALAAARARRAAPPPSWLGPAARQEARTPAPEPWRRRRTPHARGHQAWLLTDARAAMGVHDHLRRVAELSGVGDAHPFLDVDLVELVLGLPAEHAFDRRLDRALLRRAMQDLLPEPLRLRADKVFFDALLLESLTGPDRPLIERTLTAGALELGGLVNAERLRDLWARGPGGCARGPRTWSAEIWRAFALETWLRREAGRA